MILILRSTATTTEERYHGTPDNPPLVSPRSGPSPLAPPDS